ncbi:MAG: sigma-70 family RNA polymerase sigma factor, partial [Planctomycetota bacterium]
AVRAITATHVVWSRNAGPGVPSPILSRNRLYWVGTNGSLTCADVTTGRTRWRKRIGAGKRNITYASLLKGGSVWLATTQQAGTIAFRLEPDFHEIAVNRFEEDTTPFKSSFAAANGELFIRSDQALFCITEGGQADLSKIDITSPEQSTTDAFASIIHRSGRLFQGRSGNSVGPAQLLMTFDVNNDDKISPEELAESPMPTFVQAMMMANGDKNKDGFIDAEEREKLQESVQAKPGEVIGRKNAADRPVRPPWSANRSTTVSSDEILDVIIIRDRPFRNLVATDDPWMVSAVRRWQELLFSTLGRHAIPLSMSTLRSGRDEQNQSDVSTEISRALDGDQQAFRDLVARYQSMLVVQMRRFSRDHAVIEELVHDVFVEAFIHLHQYRGKRPFEHWLRKIAVRVGYRLWKREIHERRQVGREPTETDVDIPDPSCSPSDAFEARDQLHAVLSKLAPRDRLVLTLLYWDGHSTAEAARLIGWTQTMVKVQAHRARKRLRRLMGAST